MVNQYFSISIWHLGNHLAISVSGHDYHLTIHGKPSGKRLHSELENHYAING